MYSWLYRIAVNTCLDRLRWNKRHYTTPLTDEDVITIPEWRYETSPREMLREAMWKRRVEQALETLPARRKPSSSCVTFRISNCVRSLKFWTAAGYHQGHAPSCHSKSSGSIASGRSTPRARARCSGRPESRGCPMNTSCPQIRRLLVEYLMRSCPKIRRPGPPPSRAMPVLPGGIRTVPTDVGDDRHRHPRRYERQPHSRAASAHQLADRSSTPLSAASQVFDLHHPGAGSGRFVSLRDFRRPVPFSVVQRKRIRFFLLERPPPYPWAILWRAGAEFRRPLLAGPSSGEWQNTRDRLGNE